MEHWGIVVDDLDAVVAGLRARGAELAGEVERYEDSYPLCYVRGPEGIIVELAEQTAEGSGRPPTASPAAAGRPGARAPSGARAAAARLRSDVLRREVAGLAVHAGK